MILRMNFRLVFWAVMQLLHVLEYICQLAPFVCSLHFKYILNCFKNKGTIHGTTILNSTSTLIKT